MPRILIALVGLVLVGVASPVARAQELWGEIDLPGGVAAARQVASLGDGEHRLHSTFLLDFARKYASGERLERSVQRLATYLETIEYLRLDLEQWPDGIALPTPQTPREERTRLEALFESMGLSLRSQDRQYRLELSGSDGARERRALLQQVNVDTDGIVAALNSGTRLKVPIPHSPLPLPLPNWWSTEVFQRAAAQGSFMWSGQATTVPLLAILRNQSASYTYLGLMALDAETLQFLAERPRLVNTLRDLVGGAFATFSRSLRVRQGTLDLPGGAETAPLWSSLVGRSPSDPEGFLPSLLAADNGRLAYFYDTVASLAPPRQAFVLGTHLPAADRVAFVRRIYRKFIDVAPAWNITKAPFERPTFDPAVALMFVDVLPAGTVGPPWWSGLLAQVFAQDNWPAEAGDSPRVSSTAPADAAWLVEWLFADPAQTTARFGVLRFAQRMFPTIDPGQSRAVEIALRARKDMPALALALERMNVRDPALVVALASAAHRLTLAGTYEQAAPGLRRWQGALALVERMHLSATWPSARLAPLLKSLAEMVPDKGALPAGAIAAWLCEQLLPVLIERGPIESERQFLELLMGLPPQREETFTWEGLRYIARPRTATVTSALAIRRASPGPQLQDLVQLQSARRRLEAGGQTLDGLRAVTASLVALEPAMASLPRVEGKAPVMAVEFKEAVTVLNRISTSDAAAQPGRELPPLLIALDALTDAIVPPICYALAASPIDAPETVSEAWTLHSFTKLKDGGPNQPWGRIAWQLPASEVRSQGGTAVVGALVALDVAFAQSKLVRLPSPDFPAPEWLSELDAKYLVQALVLGDGEPEIKRHFTVRSTR